MKKLLLLAGSVSAAASALVTLLLVLAVVMGIIGLLFYLTPPPKSTQLYSCPGGEVVIDQSYCEYYVQQAAAASNQPATPSQEPQAPSTPESPASPEPANGSQPVTSPAPKPAEKITAERVKAVVERIRGVELLSDGAQIEVKIASQRFGIEKINGRVVPTTGSSEPDLRINIYAQESFVEIEKSSDVCAKITELGKKGKISYQKLASDFDLLLKGYENLCS